MPWVWDLGSPTGRHLVNRVRLQPGLSVQAEEGSWAPGQVAKGRLQLQSSVEQVDASGDSLPTKLSVHLSR